MPYNDDNKPVNVMKASRMLQAKVGTGEIKKENIEKSQQIIENAKDIVDFAPMAIEHVDQLDEAVKNTEVGSTDKEMLQKFIDPVMQLKANASMFNYELLGTLTNIMLNFLEAIKVFDNDVKDITSAHILTLRYIVNNRLTGDGGAHGEEFQKELKEACRRYFVKHK